MKPIHKHAMPARQSGTVLLVAVVLLLLAGVMTLAALNVGIFEQRSTGNDIRAKEVNNVAEAGLAQGFEYLMRQHPEMMEDDTLWVKCNDTVFPCGAINGTVDDDLDTSTPEVARRTTMFRLINSGHTDTNFNNPMPQRMFDMSGNMTTIDNGVTVAYGVAPVLCYVAARLPTESASAPIRCANSMSEATDRRIVTFVSVARLPGEGARTTLTQTVGRYPLLPSLLGKPPVIASGSVDVTGTLQVVTNPNSGGAGVPVTIWTRKDVAKTGTPNTCYADEFFRFGAKNNAPPTLDGSSIICDTCQCAGDKSLSYDNSGNVQAEGIDILDVDAGTNSQTTFATGGQVGANDNVHSDSQSYPTCEFPPDLFAHIFGVNAWKDADLDCIGEQKITQAFTNPNTSTTVTIGADEAYLYTNASHIVNATTAGAALATPAQVAAVSYPSSGLSGMVWCQSNCDIGSNTQLGTPANPVILIVDGPTRIQGRVFGLIFLRTLVNGATLTPAGGYTMTNTEIANGGTANLRMNAGSAVYGSVVVQGQVEKANGTAAIIYDASVLGKAYSNAGNKYSTLPGAWNDISSY